jgi:putative ABC transport system permease protein
MNDFVFGLRNLRTHRAYAALTIITIAIGIAVSTTLFSVANGVLLKPLPFAESERLVELTEFRGGRQARIPATILNGTYLAWREAPAALEEIGAWGTNVVTVTGRGDATRVEVATMTPSLLAVLKVTPLLGRAFTEHEGEAGQAPVAIVSHGYWQQQLGGTSGAIGQTVEINGTATAIVGVMPAAFAFPNRDIRIWLPRSIPTVDDGKGNKRGTIIRAWARLRPGVTAAQAAAEGTARANAATDAGPVAMALFGARGPIHVTAVPARDAVTADIRPAILIMLAAAVLLFATAVANVANLQAARATARHRELTIRSAIGASTLRLARQLLIENAILGMLGGLAGLLFAAGLHRALPFLVPSGFPRVDAIAVDAPVLLFALVLTVITSLACGVLPLLQLRRLDLVRALAEGGLASSGPGKGGRVALTRELIVASQVAVTCVLLVGATVLMRSYLAQAGADRGYDPSNVLTANLPLPRGYSVERKAQLRDQLLDRLKSRPGVTHVAASTALPLASAGGFASFTFQSPFRSGAEIEVQTIRRFVTPGYFGALGIRVVAGRPLTEADSAVTPPAVVVNRSFVQQYLDDVPLDRALGQSLGMNATRESKVQAPTQIVGIVDDVKQDGADGPPQPEMFVSVAQLPGLNFEGWYLVVRTEDDPAAYVDSLRQLVREQDPAIAIDSVLTMDQRVGASLSKPRSYATLLGGFALFALLIAGTGLFAVLSYTVAQRSRELAVRSSLGATRGNIVGLVFRQMAMTTGGGLAIGLAAAWFLSTTLAPFVYGVRPRDWMSFTASAAVLLLVGGLACVVPARRVAQTDPIQVLRES